MIGRAFKHYEIEEELGKGGMGVVYRARDTRLGRAVAIKLLPPEFTKDPDRNGRFLQEARAASAVNHPAIAQIYDVDEDSSGVFIAMELVPGKTVKALIQGKELDLLGALEVAIQVAGGLQKAHEAGIVHRDIKPENVMVTPDGHAKILDFGLAKLMEPPGGGSADEVSHMETLAKTQAGTVLGTLRYMSPEQARGLTIDHRSDIFSFGVLLYEMVTGQLPFSGNTPVDTLHAIAFEETRPVSQLRANLPPSLQRVISRCLRKRAPDRYPDCKELAADLKTVQREAESGISAKVSIGERLRERFGALGSLTPGGWMVPAAVGGLVVGVLFVFLGVGGVRGPSISLGIAGLLIWRRLRNRRLRLSRKFASKARRLPEVRIVALDAMKLTVVADQAVAKTYVRLNAILDGINSSMFFGEPFSMAIRDDLGPEEVRTLLTGPGILYVRDDRDALPAKPAS
jgi:serine/threonine protein kinase